MNQALTSIDGTVTRLLALMPASIANLLVFGIAILLALLIGHYLQLLLTRLVSERDTFQRSLVLRTRQTLRFALIVVTCWIAAFVAPLSWEATRVVQHALLIGIIILAVLAARSALHIWVTLYLRRFTLEAEDNLLARKHVTQSRILQRVAVTVLVIVGIAMVLMTFEGVQQWGISLLASAGAAGLVLGLALQPVLKNLFAGIQIAVTQPIRIHDALLVEGEWGTVEEIGSTYVVVKTWDWRRLILPLSYFIEKPFQNWTRDDTSLIGSVILYLDYTVPVDVIRQQLKQIVEQSPHWDRNIANVQVTDLRETSMEIRILVTARNAGQAFDLRCEVREKLIAFLQSEYPQTLPRVRTQSPAAGEMGLGEGVGDGHA